MNKVNRTDDNKLPGDGGPLEIIRGKKSSFISADEFLERCEGYSSVHLDLGTGDGAFAFRSARQNPDRFLVGVDPERSNLSQYSSKALKKPAKGGITNVIFIVSTVENMPEAFDSLFDHININFPWSGLLRGLLEPDKWILEKINNVLKPGATGDIFFNYHIFKGKDLIETLKLPELDENYIENTLIPEYEACGIEVPEHKFLKYDEVNIPSTWAGRLLKNSRRETLHITLRKKA